MIGHGKGLFTMRNGYRGRMRTISRRHAASQTTAQSEMTAQSKLSDGDGDKDKFKESGKSKFEFGLLFDPTQMVLPALCLAPVLYFNNSQRGKSWYADTFKAFAGNNEGLAKYLWFGVTKAVAVPAFIGGSLVLFRYEQRGRGLHVYACSTQLTTPCFCSDIILISTPHPS